MKKGKEIQREREIERERKREREMQQGKEIQREREMKQGKERERQKQRDEARKREYLKREQIEILVTKKVLEQESERERECSFQNEIISIKNITQNFKNKFLI